VPATGSATSLSYDQANRLTAYGSSAAYAYNGDGLRMSKTVSGSTSQFLWDVVPAVPVLLRDGLTAYVYGPGGLPVEQINGSGVLWLQHDQLGSTRLVTDNGGNALATYTFDSYGRLTAVTGTITNSFRFAGEYNDSESGLYYLRARYYDPSTAQFLSGDPMVTTTRERYAYVADNPLNRTDPSGLLWTAGCIGGNAGFLAGVIDQYCLGVVTRNGGTGFDILHDIAITHTYTDGVGGQTPYIGGGVGAQISNADYTDEQGKGFAYLGGGGDCLFGASATGFLGRGRRGQPIYGGDVLVGVGLGVDVHGGGSWTDVTTPQDIGNTVGAAVQHVQQAWNWLTHL
jgi:RHS repeat-associated protein